MKVNKLALAIGITFTTIAASPSYALLISTQTTSTTTVNIDGKALSNTDGPAGNTSSTTYNEKAFGNYRVHGYSSAYGKTTGESGLISYGSPFLDRNFLTSSTQLTSKAQVLHKAVITNNTKSGQLVDFSFLILSGELGLGYSTNYNDSGTLIQSGYAADIRVNGVSRWNSAATLTAVYDWWDDGHNLFSSGTSIGTQTDNGLSYEWGNYAGVLNLGYLAAGASITLEYQLNTFVNEYLADAGYAHTPEARFDDPFGFSSTPIFDDSNFVLTHAEPPINAPEPANTLLVGAGLAALAFRRRSRKKAV